MVKPKKNLMMPTRQALSIAMPESQERDLIVDQVVRLVGNFGFRQILVSPLEERQSFFKNPKFLKHFGEKALEINHEQKELILTPTNLHGVFKRFLSNLKVRGPHVVKWFYISPVTQNLDSKPVLHHELGIFVLGDDSSLAHAQLVNTVNQVFSGLGMSEINIELNSLGCNVCQKEYQNILKDSFGKSNLSLCENCISNLAENPLAVWTCQKVSCQTLLASAPQMVDFLDDPCRQTLIGLLETLDSLGVTYNMNSSLVGSHVSENIIFQTTIPESSPRVVLGEGGSFSSWSHFSAEESAPLLGFVTAVEDIWNYIPEEKRNARTPVEVFLIPLGQIASRKVIGLQKDLQAGGVTVAEAMLDSGGIKNQLKEAADHKSEISLIIGQKEALDDTVILRDMRSGMQEVFANERIVEEVKKRLGK